MVRTRLASSGSTRRRPVRTLDTVAGDTAADRATSWIVGRLPSGLAPRRFWGPSDKHPPEKRLNMGYRARLAAASSAAVRLGWPRVFFMSQVESARARLDGRDRRELGRHFMLRVGWKVERGQRYQWHVQLGFAIAAIDQTCDGGDVAAMRPTACHALTGRKARRDHVLGHDDPAAWRNVEAASQGEAAFHALHENRGAAELSAELVAQHDPTEGRSHHEIRRNGPNACRQAAYQPCGPRWVHQHPSTLQVERAVQARCQHE